MQKFSYHTHSFLSDGSDAIRDMIEKAISLGWEQIGFSDHMIIHKNIKNAPTYEKQITRSGEHIYHHSFEKALPIFQKNADYIRKIAKNYPIDVLIGFEVDYFTYNGWKDEFNNFIKQIDHDYLINGNHFFFDEDCNILIDIYRYDTLDEEYKKEGYENYITRHYKTIQKAVSSEMFSFLAHLDYARRTNMHNKFPCDAERLKIIDCLEKHNIAVEISTKGLRKVDSFYPQDFLLKEIINKKIPVVISDDAHNVNELGYCFDKAENKLRELNCKYRFSLK